MGRHDVINGITTARCCFTRDTYTAFRLAMRLLLTRLLGSFQVRHLLQVDKYRLFWLSFGLRQVIQQSANSNMQEERQDQQVEK